MSYDSIVTDSLAPAAVDPYAAYAGQTLIQRGCDPGTAGLTISTVLWATSAILLGCLSAFLLLAYPVAISLLGSGTLNSSAWNDVLEGFCAFWFVVGGLAVIMRRPGSARILIAAAGAAVLMNAFDLLRDLSFGNVELQVGASAYCLLLLRHMKTKH